MLEIHPKLWLGNRDEISNVDLKGIVDVIVYLGQEMNDTRLTHKNSLPIVHFPLNDGHNLKEKYTILNGILSYLTTVHNAKVLLACRYGLSRSPSIAISYLMINEGWQYDFAYRFVKRKVKKYSPVDELLVDIKGLR